MTLPPSTHFTFTCQGVKRPPGCPRTEQSVYVWAFDHREAWKTFEALYPPERFTATKMQCPVNYEF